MSASVPLTAIAEMLHKHRCTFQTRRERKQSPQVSNSPIAKIKTAKISETGILAYFAKICTHEITVFKLNDAL